ncbi:MAG: hypothetical protein ACR2Q3_09535 [Woeseiaceae bacterium]
MASGVFYSGTTEDVRLGDRIEYTSLLLRRKRLGTVVCIPDKTALERAREKKQPENWLIKFDDGTFTGWMYHPEEIQPNKRLRLVDRGDDFEPISNEELDRLDAEESEKTSGMVGQFLGCLTVVAIVVVGLIALIRLF